jgi:hypothetical protein
VDSPDGVPGITLTFRAAAELPRRRADFHVVHLLESGPDPLRRAGSLGHLAEKVMGLVLFSSLISKMLGNQQEEVLTEVYRLTFENRLGRLRTNLHLVLSELSRSQMTAPTAAGPDSPTGIATRAAFL